MQKRYATMLVCFRRGHTILLVVHLYANLLYFQANPFNPRASAPWMIGLWINFAFILYAHLRPLFLHPWKAKKIARKVKRKEGGLIANVRIICVFGGY